MQNQVQTEEIIEETQREAIVNRPHNLAGSVKRMRKERFSISKDEIKLQSTNTIPALLKLFMESIDNPIDVAIKGGCNLIQVNVDSKSIHIRDNGYGISSGQDDKGEYILYKAMCKYNTSANYAKEIKGQGQKGVNGIGIKLCTTLSTQFKVTSDDGVKRVTVVAKDNNHIHTFKEEPTTGKTGLDVKFSPDFSLFDTEEIDKEHLDRMYEYTLIQALTYPDITFKFNNKVIKYTSKKFLDLFDSEYISDTQEDYFFSIMPNKMDDFKQVSFINGLETYKAGTHIDFIMDRVVAGIRAKLIKKHKSIKPGDIKNKLQLVLIGKNMRNIDWEGQTKSEMSTPNNILSDYFKNTDFDKLVAKILKSDDIMLPITELFVLKEQAKLNAELKRLNKGTKKIKSEKYLPATGVKKYLMITEGASATGGLMPVLGRKEVGYAELKGKPLNVMSASQSKFTQNAEMSELYKIIAQEGYQHIIFATDQDLDGFHIRGLLIGLFHRYLPEFKGKVGVLNTPVIGIKKGKKLTNWHYSLSDEVKLKSGETSKYYKGLGSWREADLKQIVQTDGLSKMIDMFVWDNDTIINDWLSTNESDKRKEYIRNNNFSIAKL